MNIKREIDHMKARAVMAFSSRLSKSVREAMTSCKDATGLIECVGFYDLENGMSSFRFLVVTPSDTEPSLRFFDMRGVEIHAPVKLLSKEQLVDQDDRPGATAYVLAAELPTDTLGLYVAAGEGGFLRFTPGQHTRFLNERIAKMCNPGVDGLYGEWIKKDERRDDADDSSDLALRPLMSVITPVYNTPIGFLSDLADSLKAQTYPRWEHILVNASPDNEEVSAFLRSLDDSRFKVITLDENKGIAENTIAGIQVASGDYLSFLDHDDIVDAHILEECVRAINEDPSIDLLYCDEDTISEDGAIRSAPMLKPEFNIDLLTSLNYVLHMLTVSRRAYEKIVPYDSEVDGSQDYDLTLKVAEVADRIKRIPRVLYHWRMHDSSVNGGSIAAKPYAIETGQRALNRHYERQEVEARVEPVEVLWLFRTDYAPSTARDVSLVVVSHDEESTRHLEESLEGQRTSILVETLIAGEDNLDEVIRKAKGDYVIIADDSVAFEDDCDALGRLRDALARPDLGIVSAKSITPEGLNLHVGLCVKSDGTFGYLNQGFVQGMGGGYNGCAEAQCDYSAVDLSCAAFRKADFEAVGGLSGEYDMPLARAVDFSFRMRDLGKLVMVDPDAHVVAQASLEQLLLGYSHLSDRPQDVARLWSHWGDGYRTDILANSNYTLDNSYFNLKL